MSASATNTDIVVIKDATLLCEFDSATVLGLPTGQIVVMPDYLMNEDLLHAIKGPLLLTPGTRSCAFIVPWDGTLIHRHSEDIVPTTTCESTREVVPMSHLHVLGQVISIAFSTQTKRWAICDNVFRPGFAMRERNRNNARIDAIQTRNRIAHIDALIGEADVRWLLDLGASGYQMQKGTEGNET